MAGEEEKQQEEKQEQKKNDRNDNTIFIGNKAFMNYVTAVVMQFTTKGAKKVDVLARGKFIARAVDVVEIATKRFLEGKYKVENVVIDSEDFTYKENKEVRVSTIKITLVEA